MLSQRMGKFTAVYRKRGRWFIGTVEGIPGVNTQARTLAQAKRNLGDALSLIRAVRSSTRTITHAELSRRLERKERLVMSKRPITARQLETLIDQMPLTVKIRLAKKLERETWASRWNEVVTKLRRKAKQRNLTSGKIRRLCEEARQEIYGRTQGRS